MQYIQNVYKNIRMKKKIVITTYHTKFFQDETNLSKPDPVYT